MGVFYFTVKNNQPGLFDDLSANTSVLDFEFHHIRCIPSPKLHVSRFYPDPLFGDFPLPIFADEAKRNHHSGCQFNCHMPVYFVYLS
jgi:hypothetical protein